MLNAIMLNVARLNVIMLTVIMLNVARLNVIMLTVVMLNVVRPNVVRLNVVASMGQVEKQTKKFQSCLLTCFNWD
jgi:hypothetical protein